jgi:hypothetical protein
VVGTLEYASALRNLDAFVSAATPDELAAADKFIADRPEYHVFTGLAERIRPAGEKPATSTAKAAPQQGLMWVVALARIEAGSILATFSKVPQPFEVVGPTRWELPAYRELLRDGAQTHYWALAQDPNVAAVKMKVPDSQTLAYLRRLNLARAMLSAAARSNASELSEQGWSTLVEQDQQLLSLQNAITFRVTKHLKALQATTNRTTLPPEVVKAAAACPSQLRAEQAELLQGTAKVQFFKTKRN